MDLSQNDLKKFTGNDLCVVHHDDVPDLVPTYYHAEYTPRSNAFSTTNSGKITESVFSINIKEWENYSKFLVLSLGLVDDEHKNKVLDIGKSSGSGGLEFRVPTSNVPGFGFHIKLFYDVGIKTISVSYTKTLEVM